MAFRTSLRVRLLATMATALSPILILALFQAVADVQKSRDTRRQELIIKADDAIDLVEQNLAEAELLLHLYRDEIFSGSCKQVFDIIRVERPIITNVIAVDENGVTTCSAVGEIGQSLDDPSWHEHLEQGTQTLRTSAFYGRSSQDWVFAIFNRLTSESDDFLGSVGFGLKADKLGNPLRVGLQDTGIDIAIADNEGRVFGGELFTTIPAQWISELFAGDRAVLHVHLYKDVSYDTVIAPLGAGGVYAVMSRPSPGLMSQVLLQPVRSFGLPLLAFLVTLLAAWWAVDALILKWLRRLTRVAGIYGRGRYALTDTETIDLAPIEISQLAESLNNMASRIGEREHELTDAIKKRDEAVKEIHHRVKNNLQIVSSFLNLEARASKNADTKIVLGNARNRISALSIVHQTLYQHERLDSVELEPFLEALLTHLREALGMADLGVQLEWDIDNVVRDSDDAIPLALLVLELITNAMKHAFDEEGGRINVALSQVDEDLRLTVSDDGAGVSEPDAPMHKGLGTRLVAAFTRQLRAEMTTQSSAGQGYTVVLKIPHAE